MAIELPKEPLILRETLEELGNIRFREARLLFEQGCYAGAVYLGGYSVECFLKAAICAALDWDGLRATFAVHDLDGLLLHSGLARRMESKSEVKDSFASLKEIWIVHGKRSVRYRKPTVFGRDDAQKFLDWVGGEEHGVVPWVKEQIS